MPINLKKRYDAIVVGSGVTGGYAAKELTEKGLETLMLERGRDVQHRTDYVTEHKEYWEFPMRERRLLAEQAPEHHVQSRTGQFREATRHFFLNDAEHPYVEAKPFTWIQGNQVGGKSLIWARQCYRWSDLDFTANVQDGHGVDWPIRYADIAPWYSQVERFVGISGERLGLPYLPDGEFQRPMELNAGEKLLKAGIETHFPGRHLTVGRVAVLTETLGDRLPCHYCGPCFRGCSTGSYFSTQSSTLPAAMATGKLTLRPHSLTHSVIYDEQRDRATGVRFVDTTTGEMHEVEAGVIFLCASALGSTQILLNSRTPRFPNGLGNSSGTLGRYLMDHHFRAGAEGTIPGLEDRYWQGTRPNGIYIPRFRNLRSAGSDGLGFTRGYGYQGAAVRQDWNSGTARPGLGAEFKRSLRDPGPWRIRINAFGECVPQHGNYVELADETDRWGVPLLRIHASWGPNELAMRKDMAASAAEMLEGAGCVDVQPFDDLREDGYGAEFGLGIHEMGTARMGNDPRTSVLNAYNQVHDAPNVFVTDGACMTSASCVNPSITYLALTARAAAHAVEESRRHNL
jgi:choline dehydrogenase-like flavoprotein